MASHLASMKVENEQALHRIAFLESNLQIQIQQTQAAEARKVELQQRREGWQSVYHGWRYGCKDAPQGRLRGARAV